MLSDSHFVNFVSLLSILQPFLRILLMFGKFVDTINELDLEEKEDPAFSTTDVSGTALDVSAGLYYSHRNWSHEHEGDGKGNGHSPQAVGRKG